MTKHLLFLSTALAALCATSQPVAAQVVTVTAGNQISALSPINHASSEGAFETVYLQSTINQAGTITRLAFEKSDGTELLPLTGVVIYLKTTSATEFLTGTLDTLGYQRVYTGSYPNSAPSGYLDVTLQRPFLYANQPNQNLAVLVTRRNGNVQATIGPRARYLYGVTSAPIRIACRRYTGTAPVTSSTTLTATNILPNLRLTFGVGAPTRPAALAQGARLYPVPATSTATLATPTGYGPGSFFITDALGRTVLPITPLQAAPDGQQALDLSALPAGPYLLHLRTATRQEVLRLMRE